MIKLGKTMGPRPIDVEITDGPVDPAVNRGPIRPGT